MNAQAGIAFVSVDIVKSADTQSTQLSTALYLAKILDQNLTATNLSLNNTSTSMPKRKKESVKQHKSASRTRFPVLPKPQRIPNKRKKFLEEVEDADTHS